MKASTQMTQDLLTRETLDQRENPDGSETHKIIYIPCKRLDPIRSLINSFSTYQSLLGDFESLLGDSNSVRSCANLVKDCGRKLNPLSK